MQHKNTQTRQTQGMLFSLDEHTVPASDSSADRKEEQPPSPTVSLPPHIGVHQDVFDHFGLSDQILRTDRFADGHQERAYQVPALFQLLSHPKNNLLLCSPTGSGKTVMALCTAVQTLGDEQAVGFFTPQGHLVNQALRRCEAFLHPEAVRTANVSGETNDEERRIAYSSDDINFYVGTPQAVANDLKKQDRVPLSRMGRVFLDEVHEARGDHAFVSVIQTLRKHDLPLIGMTASPGRTLQEIEDRMHLLGATEYIAVFPPKHKVTGDPTRVHQLPEVREASKILEEGYREASKELHTLLVARGPAGIHMANEFAAMHRITQAEEDYRRSNPILYPPSEDGRVDSFTFPSMTKLKKLTDAISLEHDRHPHRTEMRSHWGTIRDHAAEIGHRLAMYNSLVLGGKFTFLNFAAKHFSHSRFPCPKNKLTFVKRCYRNTLEELQERAKQLGQGGRELEPLLKQLVVKHEGKTHLPAPHAVNRIYLRFESLARSHADADSRTWQRFFTLARELRHWYKLHESMSAGHHGSLDGMIDTVGRRAFLRRQGRIELKRNRDFALRAYKTTLEDLALSADQNPDSPLLTREHLEALGIQQSQPPTPPRIAQICSSFTTSSSTEPAPERTYQLIQELQKWSQIFSSTAEGQRSFTTKEDIETFIGKECFTAREGRLKEAYPSQSLTLGRAVMRTQDPLPFSFTHRIYRDAKTLEAIAHISGGAPLPRNPETLRYQPTLYEHIFGSSSWAEIREKFPEGTTLPHDPLFVRNEVMRRCRQELAQRPRSSGYQDSAKEHELFFRLLQHGNPKYSGEPTKLAVYINEPDTCRFYAERVQALYGQLWDTAVIVGTETQSPRERDENLEAFERGAEGKHSIAFLTSAAIQGTDIPNIKECLMMSLLRDPIAVLQFMGRMRKGGSLVWMITRDTSEEKGYTITKRRYSNMIKAHALFPEYWRQRGSKRGAELKLQIQRLLFA